MQNAPLISIITVTRNLIEAGRVDSFSRAIDCVQKQSFRGFEHIIQDGQSADGTVDMISSLTADLEQVRVFSEPDRNLYDAMNIAASRARGSYLMFMNSDDALHSKDVLELVAAALTRSSPDYAFGRDVPIGRNGERQASARTNVSAILQRMPFGHNSVLIRNSVFQDLGGHNITYPAGADYDLILRMIAQGYTGLDLKCPVSVYWTRGVSADQTKVDLDRARTWKAFFESHNVGQNFSLNDYTTFSRKGHLPVSLLISLMRSGHTSSDLRSAVRHSLFKSLKRNLQPWRFSKT